MRWWIDNAGVGPWYWFRSTMEYTYQGTRDATELIFCLANSGPMQLEIIQQMGPQPSIYQAVASGSFELDVAHHYAFWPPDAQTYDSYVAIAENLGLTVVQEMHVSRGRVTYWQAGGPTSPILEIAEYSESRQAMRDRVASEAEFWDGSDPIRDYTP
jgi:hypothetical protein